MSDERARTGTLDSTSYLWEPMHNAGKGRLPMYAMFGLGQMAGGSPSKRLVLTTMFQVAEIESFSGDGYNGTVPEDLVLWTGLAESTIAGILAELHREGLVEKIQHHTRQWRYHPPQRAWDWVNCVLPKL